MSNISSVNSSAALIYQLQQAAASKQGAKTTAPNPGQQVQAPANHADHDGDSDGSGGIDIKA
ncbi:MAG TPA: hypothetical protein VGP63_22305 [Planctomycetaceae bacterium]|jgi:hypothetical protein|nr:hypothetical protein [Planctomycetaceae bacterium]